MLRSMNNIPGITWQVSDGVGFKPRQSDSGSLTHVCLLNQLPPKNIKDSHFCLSSHLTISILCKGQFQMALGLLYVS